MEDSDAPDGFRSSAFAGAVPDTDQRDSNSQPGSSGGSGSQFATNMTPSWSFSDDISLIDTIPSPDVRSQAPPHTTNSHVPAVLPLHRGPLNAGVGRQPRQYANSEFATPEPSRPPSAASIASAFEMAPPQVGSSQLGKRRRGDTASDLLSSSLPARASKRATPDPAGSKAISMSRGSSKSSASFEMDDAEAQVFADIIGYDPRTDKTRFKMEQERAMDSFLAPDPDDQGRLQQEKEDEEFARRLQQELNEEMASFPQPSSSQQSQGAVKPPSSQSFLDSSGKVLRPQSVTPNFSGKLPSLHNTQNGGLKGSGVGSTIDLDDDEIEIIDPGNFRHNLRAQSRSNAGLSNGVDPQSWSRNLPGALGRFYTPSRPPQFPGDPLADHLDRNGPYHPGMRNTPHQDDPFMPSFSQHGFATTMDQLSRQGPLGPPSDILDQDIMYYGSRPTAYLSQPSSSPFASYNRGFSLSGPQYPSYPRTRLPWDEDGEEDLYSSYGLGNYGNSEENAEALKDLLNNIQDEETNLGAGEEERNGTPEAMADTANLYKYQQRGLAWLTKQEEGTNKGGILADDMGLGKTIQAIALMVSRRSANFSRKTNLIVAPVALIRQWESEIGSKVKRSHALSVLVYHGTSKSSKTWESLRQHDVVITTYGTLAADHKKKMELAKRKKDNPGYVPRPEDQPVLTGDDCLYYRCILDEAQNIKNKSAKTSIAAYEINAEHRLCMTGTPMMNDVIELYSLIHFLRIQPYCQWERFNVDFARPLKRGVNYNRDRAMRKLQALCKAVMLRRTKKSQMDGKPLVVLPERNTESVHAVFDDDEKAFYQALEAQTQLTFNKYLKAGTVGRNYSNMLTLLLRLRQACCHPHLLRDFAVTIDVPPETLLDNARELAQIVIDRVIENGISDCPVCMDIADNYTIFNPCGHSTCPECFCGLSDVSKNPNANGESGPQKARFSCPNCRTEVDPVKTTDYVHFKRLYEPAKAAAEGLDDIDTPHESDSDSSSESSSDSENDEETESLDGFIVKDEAPGAAADRESESEGGDDLDSTKPAKMALRPNTQPDEEKGILSGSNTVAELKPKSKQESGVAGADEFDAERDLDDLNTILSSRSKQTTTTTKREKKKEKNDQDKSKDGRARSTKEKPSKLTKRLESDDDDETFISGYKDGRNPFEKATGKKARRAKGQRKLGAKTAGSRKTLAELKKEGMKSAKSREKYFARLSKNFIPSAKVSKCMEILQQILDKPDGEKVIVFSQFTSLLDLVEIPMHRQRWRYKRFDGSMDAVSRNRSVTEFTADPRTRILLVSLKAGNAGLNLTAASQVIILDPFWNPYIEEQAIDRAHRIGQRRAVHVHRILIQDTVEDRILSLQEKKRELIEGALDEGASQNIGRLGVRELGFLFGITQ